MSDVCVSCKVDEVMEGSVAVKSFDDDAPFTLESANEGAKAALVSRSDKPMATLKASGEIFIV